MSEKKIGVLEGTIRYPRIFGGRVVRKMGRRITANCKFGVRPKNEQRVIVCGEPVQREPND